MRSRGLLSSDRRMPFQYIAIEGSIGAGKTSLAERLAARLEQNAANCAIAAPLVVVQGLADVVVPPAATDAYVAARCAAGQQVTYWTFAGLDHTSIVAPGSALTEVLFAWMQARLNDEPQPAGCSKEAF